MIKFLLFFLLLLSPYQTFASSCMLTEENVKKQSAKNHNKVKIDISKVSKHGLYVDITLPLTIDGLNFVGGYLVRKEPKNSSFAYVFPIAYTVSDNKVHMWLEASAELLKGALLSIDYGDDCGLSLKYDIVAVSTETKGGH